MKTIRRYLANEILSNTVLVFVALLGLFAFFDLIQELGELNKGDYRLSFILLYVLLSVPGHIYELFPIAALIGTLTALAQLAKNSELTVIRVSGASPTNVALAISEIGLIFVVLAFIFGEFVAPPSDREAQRLRLKATSSVVAQQFRSGIWVKDQTSFVNVEQILPDSTLLGIKIFEFDPEYHLHTISYAKQGDYQSNNVWRLQEVNQTRFTDRKTTVNILPEALWKSVITPDLLNVLLVVPEQMSAWNLYNYIKHLRANKQQTSEHEIAFWGKLSYPFAVLVMMFLALPFAYYGQRHHGIGPKVFAGVMLGLVFHFLNSLSGHLGVLNQWPPILTAILPTLFFLSTAAAMMWWIERR